MKNFIIILTCIFISTEAFSQKRKCPIPSLSFETKDCNCGEHLNNLKITLPKGLKVMTACLFDYNRPIPNRRIDLRNENASLDRYRGGNLPEGSVYLSGNLNLDGTVVYEPGNTGEYFFYPDWNYDADTRFSNIIGDLKLPSNSLPAKLKVKNSMLDNECLKATAKINISGLSVLIGDSDEAGAYAINTKLLNIEKYEPCKQIP